MKVRQIDVMNDPEMTLEEWGFQINGLKEQYGGDAVMYTDAGYNNVELIIEVEMGDSHEKN